MLDKFYAKNSTLIYFLKLDFFGLGVDSHADESEKHLESEQNTSGSGAGTPAALSSGHVGDVTLFSADLRHQEEEKHASVPAKPQSTSIAMEKLQTELLVTGKY